MGLWGLSPGELQVRPYRWILGNIKGSQVTKIIVIFHHISEDRLFFWRIINILTNVTSWW